MKSKIHEEQKLNKIMSKKKIYIAGKVTGLPEQEALANFATAQHQLEAFNFEVVNPMTLITDRATPWDKAMKTCIIALMGCECIFMLSDWQHSKGAKIEHNLALLLGIEIIEATIAYE